MSIYNAAPHDRNEPALTSIVAFAPNLMDRSKFPPNVVFISAAGALDDLHPDIIVVDLDRCDDAADFLQPGTVTIGYGPHVESAQCHQAERLGYDRVLARSIFFKRITELLEEPVR